MRTPYSARIALALAMASLSSSGIDLGSFTDPLEEPKAKTQEDLDKEAVKIAKADAKRKMRAEKRNKTKET